MRVTICGPNLRDQSKGTFHVHAEGCADLARHASREPEYRNGWTVDAESRKDIVTAIYDPSDFQYDADTEWRDYDDMYLFPCCGSLS